MLKKEAEIRIIREAHFYFGKNPNQARDPMGAILFHEYLKNERPDLLDFRSMADKHQLIHGWLKKRKIID